MTTIGHDLSVQSRSSEKSALTKQQTKSTTFSEMLQDKQKSIKVSHHAQKRLTDRELTLQEQDYASLSTAMSELAAKGSKESLLVYKDIGLIADVHSRTIITAMGMNELNTVTNIDSATFIK
jgi:flagellar operon protein